MKSIISDEIHIPHKLLNYFEIDKYYISMKV